MEDSCAMEVCDMHPEAEEESDNREDEVRKESESEGGAVAECKDGGEEKRRSGGDGILNNLLANLVAPMSPRASAATIDKDHRQEAFQEALSPPPAGVDGAEKEDGSGNGNGGGGIIVNIVSHLPKSLPDVAPTNDEASILIHAIVHD